jgi:hypothetical protein
MSHMQYIVQSSQQTVHGICCLCLVRDAFLDRETQKLYCIVPNFVIIGLIPMVEACPQQLKAILIPKLGWFLWPIRVSTNEMMMWSL